MKLSIWNFKGGVGKTSIALGIADVLTKKYKRRTLVIDLDPQGDASSTLGYNSYKGPYGIKNAMNDECPLTPLPVKDNEYLFISPATTALAEFTYQIAMRIGRDAMLEKCLNFVDHEFDYILIDCPPTVGPLVSCALFASDGLLVPVDSGRFALDKLPEVLLAFNQVKSIKPDLAFKGIVQNKFEKNTSASQAVRELLQEQYPVYLLKTIISKNSEVTNSEFSRLLNSDSKANSKIYEEFTKLLTELFYI